MFIGVFVGLIRFFYENSPKIAKKVGNRVEWAGNLQRNGGEFLKIEIVTELTTTLWGRMRKSLQKKRK